MSIEKQNALIPDAVRDFVIHKIASVDQLETLLLLHSEPDRVWTAAEIGRELRTNTTAGQRGLASLTALGVSVQVEQGFKFSAPDASLAELITQLAKSYQERRVAIITLIYSKPTRDIEAFAEAFRVKKTPLPRDTQ